MASDTTLVRRPPLDGVAAFDDEGISITALPPRTRHLLRAPPQALGPAGEALGFAIPGRLRACEGPKDRAALWLGPDEWLILEPEENSSGTAENLALALRGMPYSLVDVSHRQTGLGVSGGLAARILASGCPLDPDAGAFPPGMVARSLFQKCEIVLWRRGPAAFHVEVWRSFAPYLRDHLIEARRGAAGP